MYQNFKYNFEKNIIFFINRKIFRLFSSKNEIKNKKISIIASFFKYIFCFNIFHTKTIRPNMKYKPNNTKKSILFNFPIYFYCIWTNLLSKQRLKIKNNTLNHFYSKFYILSFSFHHQKYRLKPKRMNFFNWIFNFMT